MDARLRSGDAVAVLEPTVIASLDSAQSPIALRGWRMVRVLGVSSTAVTALVVPPADAAQARTRVLRLFAATTPDHLIDDEVAVHDALAHAARSMADEDDSVDRRPHWAQAEALVSADDGRVGLVVEAVTGPTGAAWLAENGPVRAGQATTLLAPIAEAIHHAHDHGVLGIVPELASVRIDSAGTPIIVGLHHGALRPVLPERFRQADALHEHDRQALARLVHAVAGHVEPDSRSAIAALASTALDGPLALRDALLREARPEPLAASRPGAGDSRPLESSLDERSAPRSHEPEAGGAHVGAEPAPPRGGATRARVRDLLGSLGLPEALITSVDTAVARGFGLVDRLESIPFAHRIRTTVRPRFLLLGAAGALAVGLALVHVLAPSPPARSIDDAKDSLVSEAPREPAHDSGSPADGGGVPLLNGAPESLEHPDPADWNPLVEELLQRWSSCRSLVGEGCQAAVVQPHSAAAALLAVDDARHTTIDAWLLGERELVVVERMGSAAIVDLLESGRTTASLLLMRSEAGWRVRDVLD